MRPSVHVNCAITLDGRLAGPGGRPLRISNEEDLDRVHRLRSQCDAILVGIGTVEADDPKLTVKWERVGAPAREPLRVILDSSFRTPSGAEVRSDAAPTLWFVAPETEVVPPGVTVERVPRAGGGLDLGAVLDRLGERGVRRLMVEGGGRVIEGFVGGGLVDRMTVFVAAWALGRNDAPGLAPLDLKAHLRLEDAAVVGDGVLLTWTRRPR